MSRVADALRRADEGHAAPAADPPPAANDTQGAVAPAAESPWDLEAPHAADAAPRLHAVTRPAAEPAPSDEGRGDEFVELVQRVFRPGTGEPTARSVTFVSVGAIDVSRSVALDVGRTLAGHGAGSVCVVDASFGNAALHVHMGVPAGPGLCDALLGSRPAASLAVPAGPHLWLVPAGEEMCATPAWLPEALARALRQIAARFDFVIVEAPSVVDRSGMATLLTVASLTDGVVLILESTRTRRDVAHDVAARLRATGATVLGAVLATPAPRQAAPADGWRVDR